MGLVPMAARAAALRPSLLLTTRPLKVMLPQLQHGTRRMGIISIREFNASVSRTLARVEAGETIEITRNGKIIAELKPKVSRKLNDPERQKAFEELMDFLKEGISLGGPASYEERTGR